MRKFAYLLSRKTAQSVELFNRSLLDELPNQLVISGCERFTINLFDDAVKHAEPLRLQHQQPAIDAVVFAWQQSDVTATALLPMLNHYGVVLSAYLLREHLPIAEPDKLAIQENKKGVRTPGMMQLAFLKVPNRLQYSEWLSIWRDQHTQVAIDLQSTFIYRQNVVERCITETDLGYSGIVEEAFPAEAMTSQQAFYAAQSDAELLERQAAMWNSSKRFIDLTDLDVLPSSEYRW